MEKEKLLKLINGETLSDKDISEVLYDICDTVHASCDSECPVYETLNGKQCECFKNGAEMLKRLRK